MARSSAGDGAAQGFVTAQGTALLLEPGAGPVLAIPCETSEGGKYALVASKGSITAAGGGSTIGPSSHPAVALHALAGHWQLLRASTFPRIGIVAAKGPKNGMPSGQKFGKARHGSSLCQFASFCKVLLSCPGMSGGSRKLIAPARPTVMVNIGSPAGPRLTFEGLRA